MTHVLVLGGGVIGLSTAATLLAMGLRVQVCARAFVAGTTSAVAGAFWYPYRAYPEERVAPWARASYRRFVELARDPATGVRPREALEVFPAATAAPSWARDLPDFAELGPRALPPGYAAGYRFTSLVVDTSLYLPWLLRHVEALGGELRERTYKDLDEALAECPRVVCCAGLGARELAPDPALQPVRGQVVRARDPGITRVWVDEHSGGITYIVPRTRDVILGGTSDEGATDLAPDAARAREIIRRCARLEPTLADAEILSIAVGLRPVRPVVRLELERRARGVVVHNYGHGGAGVTLSWGCAADAADHLLRA